MKKGKLSKLEIRFIETSTLSPEEISEELDRPLETIQQYIKKAEDKKKVSEKVGTVFGKKKHGTSSVIVAHQGSSERADENFKKRQKVKGNSDCIHFT